MRLVRLIYASKFNSEKFSVEEFKNIEAKASTFNSINHLTGILVMGEDCFLQCIEGSSLLVNKLFSKISADPRHSDIFILDYQETSHREFEAWGMRCVLLTKEKKKLIKRFSINEDFNPSLMSGGSALEFLVALKS